MNAFAYSSYKHRSDQDLLDRLGRAIFVLKLQAQDRLPAYGMGARDPDEERIHIEHFLDDLSRCVRVLTLEHIDDLDPADISHRVAELIRLRDRLDREPDGPLKERDFRLLDGIQALLEQETAEGVRGLYAF